MGRTVYITGASAGFGEAIAKRLASEGNNLVITGRRSERLNALANQLESEHNVRVYTSSFDVRDNEEVTQAVHALPKEFQNIDVLVNNAGLAVGRTTIDKGDVEDWDRMLDTNVKGLLYVSRAIMPGMVKRKAGHIVNIGSTAGKETYKDGNVYCASKHAVDAITKAMRADLLEHGIKVTGVCPGLAETEFSIVRYKGDKEKATKVYEGIDALMAEDIADIVSYAISRPDHVCLNDIVVTPRFQANSFYTIRS